MSPPSEPMSFLSRLTASAVTLFGVASVTFVLTFVVPADPARTMAGPKADSRTLASIRHEMQLDRPLMVRYAHYLGRLVRGDMGRSYVTRQGVAAAIAERLPATALLAIVSLSLAVVLGIGFGCVTAVRAGQKTDLAVLVGSVGILSFPVFWIGMLLLYLIAFQLRLLPLGGYGRASHLVLPALTLGLRHAAYYARLVHGNLENVLAEDYVRTARAKGLPPWRVYTQHALRNALIPLTTLIGLDLAGLLSGVVLTETVFNWPGIGRLAVESVFNQDVPMIMGTVLFGAVMVVAANVVVDCVYLLIDPRLRGSEHGSMN
jgi:peptide/nickel transport system permease protein